MPKTFKSTLEDDIYFEKKKMGAKGRKGGCCRVLFFLFMFAGDFIDWISDWLFYTDVAVTEKGLVYGPHPSWVPWTLLAFSILGTFMFIFECFNLWWETFRNNPWVDSEYLSAVVIWIEDLPQISISLYIALCREEHISIFQLSKAGIVLISAILRIILMSVKYCKKKARKERHHIKTKVVIMLGIIIEFACVCAIFVLNQTEHDRDGIVSFRVPTTAIEETFNDQIYLANVSVFMHHNELFQKSSQDHTAVNWLRLASLNELRSGDGETLLRMDYEETGSGILKLAMLEKRVTDNARSSIEWTWTECYTINKMTEEITPESNAICSKSGYFIKATSLLIRFHYVKPGAVFKRKVLGDIQFNIKLSKNGQCFDWDAMEIPVTFHYFRTSKAMPPEAIKHLYSDTSGLTRFFRNPSSDLIDVSSDWKTGWLQCKSTGNHSPTMKRNLQLSCT